MTQQQMTFLIVLLFVSVLSVGAFLLVNDKQGFAVGPNPTILPATPAAPEGPPLAALEQIGSGGAPVDFEDEQFDDYEDFEDDDEFLQES